MKKQNKIILWILLTILVFLIGYYLRAYLPIHKALAYSPYEAFVKSPIRTEFIGKTGAYPIANLIKSIIPEFLKPAYIVYIFGAIIIFLLGKEITKKNLGGFLAFLLYSISSENLLQYTKDLTHSGLCYIFTWIALLFLLKYLKNKKNHQIIFFTIFSLFALTTYHTGATATIMLFLGLLISLIYSKKLDKKILFSLIGLGIFYFFWVKIFDPFQINMIINAFKNTGTTGTLVIFFSAIIFITLLFSIKNLKFLQSEYIPLILLIPSAILIFSKTHFFKIFLNLGVNNYYASAITLNNYLAQAILTHSYIFLLLPIFFRKNISKRALLLRGWFIGLVIISIGLIFEHYYARIFDYSFPLMFILFAIYWSKPRKFRKIIVISTVTLLIISQLMIYNDPFTMRRYYNQNEIDSVQNIINLNILPEDATIASDLRTAALFSYLGKTGIEFGEAKKKLHPTIFYNPQNLKNHNISYIILSESMRNIVYAMSFETKPLNQETFDFYDSNFDQIYKNNLIYIYQIKETQQNDNQSQT